MSHPLQWLINSAWAMTGDIENAEIELGGLIEREEDNASDVDRDTEYGGALDDLFNALDEAEEGIHKIVADLTVAISVAREANEKFEQVKAEKEDAA